MDDFVTLALWGTVASLAASRAEDRGETIMMWIWRVLSIANLLVATIFLAAKIWSVMK